MPIENIVSEAVKTNDESLNVVYQVPEERHKPASWWKLAYLATIKSTQIQHLLLYIKNITPLAKYTTYH